jgi:ribosomal protein S18 acetylase RimI-like enzyme
MQTTGKYLLQPDDLGAATSTMAQAFHNDPLWRFVIEDDGQRRRLLMRFFDALLGLSIGLGQAYGAGDNAAGVAVWSYPGQKLAKPPARTYLRFLPLLFSRFAIAGFKARNVFAEFERMRKTYAPGPSYYLQTIGVRPDSQGRGFSSQLIRPFIEEADARGIGVYTETVTPENVALYERFGLKCMDERPIPNTGLKAWSFYRAGTQDSK